MVAYLTREEKKMHRDFTLFSKLEEKLPVGGDKVNQSLLWAVKVITCAMGGHTARFANLAKHLLIFDNLFVKVASVDSKDICRCFGTIVNDSNDDKKWSIS